MEDKIRVILSESDYQSILNILDDRDVNLYRRFKKSIDHNYIVRKNHIEKVYDSRKAETINKIKNTILELRNDNKKVNVSQRGY